MDVGSMNHVGPPITPQRWWISQEVNTPFEVQRHDDHSALVTIPDIFAEAPEALGRCEHNDTMVQQLTH